MIRMGIRPIADVPVALSEAPAQRPVESILPEAASSTGRQAPPTMIEESFRTLRTNLLLRRESDTRTFVITSALPGEGKSTIAANLACSLAAMRKRVLLIDADLRRSAAHRFFDIPNTEGLSDVLRGAAAAEQVWQETRHGPIVLTSGPTQADPQTLLESRHLASLMARVRDQFDLVLVDSAPVLAVADTTLVVPHVDAVVLVVRYAVVSESEAALAIDRLRAGHGKVLGCVLSQVTDSDEIFHTYARQYVQSA
jgi:capsular exopolysaccharide synthesis family protein